MRGEIDSAAFHRRIAAEFGVELAREKFFEAWTSVIVLIDAMGPLVERLAARYRLVLASNTDSTHYHKSLDVQPALRHLHGSAVSYEIGHVKPSPDFFRAALRSLETPADACLFVDDTEANVHVAAALGIRALRFSSPERL
jgi:putative hydrolase of the HAD superfamily